MSSKQLETQSLKVKVLLVLLIFTPLIYSMDNDPYRAYKVITIGVLFLLIATPNLLRKSLWISNGLFYIIPLTLFIAVQPIFVQGALIGYNLNYIVVLLSCFIPSLYLSSLNFDRIPNLDTFIQKLLEILFVVAVVSLVISIFTGYGEFYLGDGVLQRRAFAWLGDSFSPVMVFFLYYYSFMRMKSRAIISAICLLFVMQAKMAMGVAILGYLTYKWIFGSNLVRISIAAIIAVLIFSAEIIYGEITSGIHNYDFTFNNRLLSYQAALEFFKSSPLFGVGANQTFKLLTTGFDPSILKSYESNMAFYEFYQIHNSYLRILAELGFVGFIFLLAFVVAIVRRSFFILKSVRVLKSSENRSLTMACCLWLISFVLFYQTTGWFEPGHPQLAWLVCFLTLRNLTFRKNYYK